MNVLGIDPAQTTGWAWGSGTIRYGRVIVPTKYGVWRLREGRRRLVDLRDHILELVQHSTVNLICYEDAPFGSINPHTKTMHAELAGIIKLVGADLGIETREYKPTTIKLWSTGSGAAKKPQMIAACRRQLGIDTDSDDVADACFVCAMGLADYIYTPVKQAKRTVKARRKKDARLF